MPENPFSTLPPQKQAEIAQRFMSLYPSNPKGHGSAVESSMTFSDAKDRWCPEGRWEWTEANIEDWISHLCGVKALGLGPNFDDATCFWACIDVDTANGEKYNFDYIEHMERIIASGLPLVVDRTKSGGLRLTVYFSEAVPCELVIKGLKKWSAQLGYTGNEIFPKQTGKLERREDCPSWVYLPYGPTWGRMISQDCLNERGSPIDIESSLYRREQSRLTLSQFSDMLGVTHHEYGDNREGNGASPNGHDNGHRTKSGRWEQLETYEGTLKETFKKGPPCLFYIGLTNCGLFQHNYLFNAAIFLKRKYFENWETALGWVNYNVLKPAGDAERLRALIKDFKRRDYEYRCKDEPIVSFCNSDACRRQPFGVGKAKTGDDYYELGIVEYNGYPVIRFVNIGEHRVEISASELMNINAFRIKCVEYGASFPDKMRQSEWDNVIRVSLQNAVHVDPPSIKRTNIDEIELLETYFTTHIPNQIRANKEEFLAGKCGDAVRVKYDEREIYFKWHRLKRYALQLQGFSRKDVHLLRNFIVKYAKENTRTDGRDWFRSTFAVSFDLFSEVILQGWWASDE